MHSLHCIYHIDCLWEKLISVKLGLEYYAQHFGIVYDFIQVRMILLQALS